MHAYNNQLVKSVINPSYIEKSKRVIEIDQQCNTHVYNLLVLYIKHELHIPLPVFKAQRYNR